MASKDEPYVQCNLRRVNGQLDVAWIPERFASKGKFLKVKNDRGEWENGWEVLEVHTRCLFSEIELKERDHLRQREASDI